MKAISIVPSETIRKHQTNNSTSKTAHQFPKQPRFVMPNPECKVAFYSNQSCLSRRKTSFGIGNKLDFTRDYTASPASTKYLIKSCFDKSSIRGRSFGSSRDKSPHQSYISPLLSKTPGPGQYENQKQTKMSQSYSLRPRTVDPTESSSARRNTPGPGAYQDADFDPKTGKFANSRFANAKCVIMNSNAPRFQSSKQTPGPFSYQSDTTKGEARYTLSQHRGSGARRFLQQKRKTFEEESNKKQLPGPGYYDCPTQFGIYGDAKYYQKLGSFKSTIE